MAKSNKQDINALKQELEFIKNQLEETSPKIDITNVYVFEKNGIYSFVRLQVEKIEGLWLNTFQVEGYLSTLTDIFSNQIIFEKCARNHIDKKEIIIDNNQTISWASIKPIYEIEHNLLAYIDKKVPQYVLQQLYYKLNNIDLNCPILKKTK